MSNPEMVERVARFVAKRRGWNWDDLPFEREAPKHGLPDQKEFLRDAALHIVAVRKADLRASRAALAALDCV